MNINKLATGAASALFLVAILASCKKENNTVPTTTEPSTSQVKTIASKYVNGANLAEQIRQNRNLMSLRVYWDNGGPNDTDFGCDGSGGNCLPDIIITAPKVYSLLSAVREGNQDAITSFIKRNYASLEKQIDPIALDAATSGNYSLILRSNSDNYACLLFTNNKDGNIELVYSFKK